MVPSTELPSAAIPSTEGVGSTQEVLRECLSLIERVWPAERGSSSGSSSELPTADASLEHQEFSPETFGRFRLIEPLGQGAFGAVFRAYDTRLRREVALKIPRPDVLATSSVRARFLREAQAAAALDHPGIVPILEAGEEGPLWYIVSAYCPGPTLAAWLESQAVPVAPRQAAAIIAELADAVQHAHFRGVLHRDLKPSNVLLETRHSGMSAHGIPTNGVPKSGDPALPFQPRVTDFGLAKRLDDPGDDTRTGVILGTPRYMSPEQAAGRVREIGVGSDVYALGAILYELLCGRPPHVAESDYAVCRSVIEENPAAPRTLRRELPRDLETICLKCLEKRPLDRYPTSGELAADLRRFLRGEPVAARPLPAVQRWWRWARRHPALAVLGVAVVVSTLSGMVGMTTMLIRERTLRREAEVSRAKAQEQTDLARRVVDDMYSQVAEKWLFKEPGAEVVREDFLRKALAFYEALSRERPTNPRRLYDLNVALHRMANMQAHLGMRDAVVRTRRSCLEVIDQLLRMEPNRLEYRFARFHNLLLLSSELGSSENPAESRTMARAAQAEIRALAAAHSGNVTVEEALFSSSLQMANWLISDGEIDEASSLVEQTLSRVESLVQRFPGDVRFMEKAAMCWEKIAWVRHIQNRDGESLHARQRCVELHTELVRCKPGDPHYREEFTKTVLQWSTALIQANQPAAALEQLARGRSAALELVEAYPQAVRFRIMQYSLEIEIGKAEFLQGNEMAACGRIAGALRGLRQIASEPDGHQEADDIIGVMTGIRLRETAKTR